MTARDPREARIGRADAMLRAGAMLLAAILGGASPLPGVTQQAVELTLTPDEAFPLQEVTVQGLPDSVSGLALRAVPLDARGREAGEPVALYAVRLEAGEPVFVAPPHPAGLDAAGRFRIEPEELSANGSPILTVRALPAAGGQTARLLDDLERIAVAIARSGGGNVDQLRGGPIEDVPLHLLGAAISLRALETAGEGIPREELEWADRWLATRAEGGALSELADELASLRSPPAEATRSGAGTTGTKVGSTDSYPFRFASTGPTVGRRAMPASLDGRRPPAPRPPWEKVEICRQCPGALNHWMTVQAELARGYGNLAERLTRDRDLFDFTESLLGPEPNPTTQKLSKGLSKARSEARKRAGNPLKNLKTPGATRGLAVLAAAMGVAELTLSINDKFLTALLPAELLPASVGLIPRRFNEDDKRAEPTDSEAGEWRLLVTARSSQLEFSAKELLGYFSSLKSILGKTESGVFGQGDKGTRSGVCVPGGTAGEGTPVGTGEAACDLAGDAIGQASKALKKYEKARKAIDKAQEARGADEAESLPEPDFELIRYGPFVWPGIDVSNPKWSAARPLGDCVRVVKRPRNSRAAWSTLDYSPADPGGSWGSVADAEGAAEIGIKPAAVGDCVVRISTRVDRFGDAAPVHLDVPSGVDEITVQVDPSPRTVEPGETVVFEPTVRHADSTEVDWSEDEGSGTLVNCGSDVSGRPCYEWTAPALDEGECRRPAAVTATSTARRGLRAEGEPVRDGSAAIRIRDPAADMQIAYRGAEVSQIVLEPGEDAPLAATGEVAEEGDVVWVASAGSIGRRGRRTTYDPPDAPGTYRVTATSDERENCAPAIDVVVKGQTEHRYFGRLQGEVGTASKGPSCGPDELPLSRGWLDWMGRESEWVAALESDTELAAHLLTRATGGFRMSTEQAYEMLKAASQGPLGAPDSGDCRRNQPQYGQMRLDVRDISGVEDSWPGNPITQAIQVEHSASANRKSLSGSTSARSRATLLERTENAHTFAIHLSGSTRGRCDDAPGATQRGMLGCGGEAFGFYTWGRILKTAEPVTVRVTLRAEASGHGTVTATFLPMAILDGRAPIAVPTAPTMNMQPLTVVASSAMQAVSEGMGAKIRERLGELSPAERAQAEAMMEGGLEEMIADATEAVDQMQGGTADGVVSLPGPPEGRDEITYYLVTMIVFEVDPADRDGAGENARFRGGFDTGTTAASVVSRIERLEGSASGTGPAPELPGLEEIAATVEFSE